MELMKHFDKMSDSDIVRGISNLMELSPKELSRSSLRPEIVLGWRVLMQRHGLALSLYMITHST